MRARRPSSAMPKPSLQPFQVMWWPVLMRLVAGWDEVMWLVVDVMSCHLMRCVTLLLCYVTWCNAMSCDVLSCDELSSAVKWCDAVGWGLVRLWRNVAGCDVTLCGSKWLCDVMTRQMIWCSVLQSPTILQTTTRYYFGFGSCWNHVWTVFVRIMLESSAIVNDASSVFSIFFKISFGMSFLVAGAIVVHVGWWGLLLRAM